MTFLYSCD